MSDAVIAVAMSPRKDDLFVYGGPDTTDYPVKFDGVRTNDVHKIDNPMHRITSRLVGWEYYVFPTDSDDGVTLAAFIEDLEDTESDEEVLELIEEYKPDT